MPIRPPALDDRRFDDLVAELVARIPAHTPEWTHPRVGDPGRTLLELFAWLGDALLYRANLIPERQRLTFLRLLGQPLRAARPARGLVTLSLKEKKAPATFLLQARASFPGPAPFESKAEISVLPITAQAYYKRPVARASLQPGLEQALVDVHQVPSISPYVTTPLFTGGAPEPEGFDVIAETADRCLWFALFAPKATAPADQQNLNKDTLAALKRPDNGGGHILNVGFVPALPSLDPLAPVSARARIPHLWEITANTTGEPITPDHKWLPEYLGLDQVASADTTNGLTQPGVLRLTLPSPGHLHPPTNDLLEDPSAGVGDRPPRLDDEALAARLLAWIRLRPPPPPTVPAAETQFIEQRERERERGITLRGPEPTAVTPVATNAVEHLRVSWVGLNALEVEQLITRTNQVFAESNGAADQEFQLPVPPMNSVEAESLNLEVEEGDGWVRWDRVDDLVALDWDANVARDARVFQLDSEAGTVRFGDGVRGRIPGDGRRIRFTQLRAGGGRAGNLPAGKLKKFSAVTQTGDRTAAADNLEVQQPLPFTGGEDAETLRDAEKRIPAWLRHRERAVTKSDYEDLARQAPGVSVGRVEVLPRFKPQQRLFNVPGVVSVMALPGAELSPAPNPRADRPFLEAVHAWLDMRRPIGTELYVIGCEYVPLAISVAVSVRDGAGPETTLQAVKEGLRRVLWPLPGGGFQGEGWPLGGTISNRELAAEVARVAGVSEVNALNLFRRMNNVWQSMQEGDGCEEQDLELAAWQLPELLAVVAQVGADAPPLIGPPANVLENSVAVPVVPEIC